MYFRSLQKNRELTEDAKAMLRSHIAEMDSEKTKSYYDGWEDRDKFIEYAGPGTRVWAEMQDRIHPNTDPL
jgi:hypothetical protein